MNKCIKIISGILLFTFLSSSSGYSYSQKQKEARQSGRLNYSRFLYDNPTEAFNIKVFIQKERKLKYSEELKEQALLTLSAYPKHLQKRIISTTESIIYTDRMKKEWAGYYLWYIGSKKGKIYVDISYAENNGGYYVLLHEFAHALDYSYKFTNKAWLSDSKEWVEIYNKGNLPTAYSNTSRMEGLADSIRFYINNPKRLKAEYREIYEFIDKIWIE